VTGNGVCMPVAEVPSQPWISLDFTLPERAVDLANLKPDTISVLAQLGRFDLVSMLLACIGILIALGAIVGYIQVTAKVKTAATKAAVDEPRKIAETEAREEVRKIVPSMLRRLMEDIDKENTAAGASGSDDAIQELMQGLDGKEVKSSD
jgi:hypothetical protein